MYQSKLYSLYKTLDKKALRRILTEPKNAIVKQFHRLFEMEGVELDFRDDALRAVAHKAMERKTGARGLRSIMEEILLNTMFELPGLENVDEVVVNEEAVSKESEPLMIYSDRKEEPASAS